MMTAGLTNSRPCCTQVDWESATGAVNMVLIHQYITNAYANVSNVVVAITPKALPPGAKAVLLNAHFDNTLGSPGLCLLHGPVAGTGTSQTAAAGRQGGAARRAL